MTKQKMTPDELLTNLLLINTPVSESIELLNYFDAKSPNPSNTGSEEGE